MYSKYSPTSGQRHKALPWSDWWNAHRPLVMQGLVIQQPNAGIFKRDFVEIVCWKKYGDFWSVYTDVFFLKLWDLFSFKTWGRSLQFLASSGFQVFPWISPIGWWAVVPCRLVGTSSSPTRWATPVIGWFINPIDYSFLSAINHP